jgi:hypothetical protein
VVEVLAVGVQCLRHLCGVLRLGAGHQLGDDDVELLVGFGLELAVLHDARDLGLDRLRQRLVLHALGHGAADVLHALAQRRVCRPLLPLVEDELRLARRVVVRMGIACGERRTGESERQRRGNGALPDAFRLDHGASPQ